MDVIYKGCDEIAVKRVADEIRRGQDPGCNENYDWIISEALVVDQTHPPPAGDDNKLVACVAEQQANMSKSAENPVEDKNDKIIDKLDKIIDVFAVQAQGGWNVPQAGWAGQRGPPRYHPYQHPYRGGRGGNRGGYGGSPKNFGSRSNRDGASTSSDSRNSNDRRQRPGPACYTCGENHPAINCPLKEYLVKAKELKEKEVGN